MNKQFIYIVAFLIYSHLGLAQTTTKISKDDFKIVVGSWQGTLTYLDYSSNKPYTMPANIDIMQIGKSGGFIFYNIYPDEPKANSSDTTTISKDGKMINEETVKSVRKLKNGDTEIITECTGKDGNDDKAAIIKHIYIIGKNVFKKEKQIQFVGQNTWLKRHEYSFTRKLLSK